MFLGSVIVVCVLCGAAALENGTSCAEVRQVFVMRGIGAAHLVPDTWTEGKDLSLCPSSQTCCSKSMESKYEEAGRKDLKNLLQGADSYLKTLISTSATKFRDTFLEMVQVAENSTNALFLDVYQSIEAQSRVPLGQLFADLLAYMSGKDVDLEERVNSFFDSFFPVAYHHSVNSNQKDFSETFKECLRDAQVEIRPFGDLSEKIASQISRSFEAARTFLEALQLGLEVINTTEHMDFGPECSEAFVRLTYCPQCQGFLQTKPCAGLCLNVVRGCLASVSELDDSWSEYVSALERLTSGMVGIYNIEHVLSTLDTKVSETVSYLMANSAEITKRVKEKCGVPRRVSREVPPATAGPSASLPPKPTYDTSLYMLLQNFVHKVAESKDFYANLADRLCSDGHLVTKGELNCWNGSGLAEYTKTVAGIGVSAQKYNPEMKPPRVRDVTVSTLADKLQHVKQILSARVTSVPQSDSSVVGEGSGSGSWWRTSDDEDYAQASGSGDQEDQSDIHFEKTEGNSKVSSGSIRGHVSIVLVIVCTLFLLK
ncbi:unnamed protein product [Larinioides sclopetarius]|uniref:Glypican-5 n=1 Tax=Larinioides sclopetarius TaxID=280406 RepID=A0AAV2ACG4_9ARAC